MKYEAGFIGAGNMGGALAAAVYKSVKSLAVFDRNEEKTAALKKTFKRVVITDPADLAANARFVFLAVKPHGTLKVAAELKSLSSEDTVVGTMAAGVALQEICEAVGTNRCIRIMPNTPAAVGQGMILYCCADGVSKQEEADFLSVMKSAGVIDKLDEKLFDAAAALSGCGPAYVYMFAEALADGAVACGVPREKAALY
ncbi:MAG: NAD(P)-binding domain-containing protein, partial [Clostridia bacterium]|nr:NAD(P)-binding domain-containing protein [Clostridia bacterium]